MRNILINREGQIRAGWRLALYVLLLAVSYFLWSLLLRVWLGNKVYSVLESLGKSASLLIPTLVVTSLFILYLDRRPWSSFGLVLNRRGLLTFACGFVLGISIILISLALSVAFPIDSEQVRILELNPTFSFDLFLLFAVVWVAAATTEEVIFRGYLLQTLKEGMGKLPALLITAILFGLPHLGGRIVVEPSTQAMTPVLAAFIATLDGLLLGVAYLRSGSLWLPIGIHFAMNFTIANILSAPLKEEFPNGVLRIDHKSQLLDAQWLSTVLPPGLTDVLLTVLIYAAAIGLLLLWRFKPTASKDSPAIASASDPFENLPQ